MHLIVEFRSLKLMNASSAPVQAQLNVCRLSSASIAMPAATKLSRHSASCIPVAARLRKALINPAAKAQQRSSRAQSAFAAAHKQMKRSEALPPLLFNAYRTTACPADGNRTFSAAFCLLLSAFRASNPRNTVRFDNRAILRHNSIRRSPAFESAYRAHARRRRDSADATC